MCNNKRPSLEGYETSAIKMKDRFTNQLPWGKGSENVQVGRSEQTELQLLDFSGSFKKMSTTHEFGTFSTMKNI